MSREWHCPEEACLHLGEHSIRIGMMAAVSYTFSYPCPDCCMVLYGTLTLALLILLSKMTLPSFYVWKDIVGRTWEYMFHSSPQGNADHPFLGQPVNHSLLSQTGSLEEHDQENGCQPQAPVDEGEDTSDAKTHLQFYSPEGGSGSSTSIRRLLCDNMACVLCERTAMEAAEALRVQRKKLSFPPLPQPPLPTVPCVDRSRLPAFSTLRHAAPFPPVSTSEPVASGILWQRKRRTEEDASPSSSTDSSPQTALVFKGGNRSFWAQSQAGHTENSDSFEGNRKQEEAEHFLISSSGISMLAVTSGAESSHSLCLTSSLHGSWNDQRPSRDLKTSLSQKDQGNVSSMKESDGSLESQDEDQQDTSIVPKQGKHFHFSHRGTSSVTSSGNLSSQVVNFVARETPFVMDVMRETLEQHVVVKRVQHSFGLPSFVLKTLSTFQHLAPNPTFHSLPKMESVLVTQPQALLFLSEKVRKRLERHVRKMVHLKHWRLPTKIHKALGHMKPDSQPPASREPPELKKEDLARPKGQRTGKHHPHAYHLASTAPRNMAHKSSHSFQAKLHIHIEKKSLKFGKETFSKRARDSQKITAPEERKLFLPKLIPPYRSHHQKNNGPSLGLQRKADSVEVNTKCKYIDFLWDLSTSYTQSLSKTETAPCVHSTIEFVEAKTPFLPHHVRQHLEMHLIKKKVQHLWGHPRLLQQSVQMFLPSAPPPPPTAHSVSTLSFQVEVKVLPNSNLPFISSEAKRHLENHIKRKIIEQRWGIPKRVMESLHKAMPCSLSLTRKSKDSKKIPVSHQEREVPRNPPSEKVPNLFGKIHLDQNKYSALRKLVAKKAIEIQMEQVDPLFYLSSVSGPQMRKRRVLPKVIPPGLKVQQLRSQELSFMEEAALSHIEFNIIHKEVTARLGLPMLYRKSLSYLFKDVKFQPCGFTRPDKDITFDFTPMETSFLNPGMRAELEWHVRRKRLQHIWGAPVLVQKSLHSFLPTVPNVKMPGNMDVTVLPAQLSFLSHATIQELDRNVVKRAIHQQWRLPKRVLESLRMLCPEMVSVEDPKHEPSKPRAIVTSSPCQLQLQPEILKKMVLHLKKKHMEMCLGAPPPLVRFSWQCASISLKQALPKLIPPGHRHLQPRGRFLPFGHPEDLDHIELSVQRNRLKSLWELGTLYTEALSRMVPRASYLLPHRPRLANALPFSEVELPFLPKQEKEDMELHIRRKRLEHKWGLPTLVQRSLRSFVPERPSLSPHWKDTGVHVHILHRELSFLSQDTCNSLELHIQRMKLKHQWELPRRVVASLRAMSPASVCGWQKPQHFLPSSIQMEDGDQPKPDLGYSLLESQWRQCFREVAGHRMIVKAISWERKVVVDFSEAQTPFLSNMDRESLELHLKKKRIQHEWGLPGLVKRSLVSFMPGAPSLHYPQKVRQHIQPMPQELSFLPADVCMLLEQHIQRMRHQQQWRLPRRVLHSLRQLGWLADTGVTGEQRTKAHSLSPEGSCEEPLEELEGRRTVASFPSEACLLTTQRSEKMQLLLLKKCIEVQTGAFPALVRQSWLSVSLRQPLTKQPCLSPRVPPRPRSSFLPFVRTEDLSRIELSVLRNHFTSLWGLSKSYAEATSALTSKPLLKHLSSRDVHVEFLEKETPFLQDQARESLERHIRKKKLEHVWGFPGLVLKSLNGFIQSAPPGLHLQKMETHIHILHQEPSFLPQNIRNQLESHLQKMQVQRQWRLPGRVLEAKRLLLHPPFGTCSSSARNEKGLPLSPGHSTTSASLPERGTGKNLLSMLGTKTTSKLQFHAAKKFAEVHLEAIPDVVSQSWRQIPLSSKEHLPKIIPPNFQQHQSRSTSFPFLSREKDGQFDMAFQCAHLASLGSSGTHDMEAVGGMTECKAFSEPVGLRWTKIEFLEAQTPFLQGREREVLEAHITKKKIHHAWGFPVLVQKSLKAFLHETPQLSLTNKTKVHIRILQQDALFLPQEIANRLESHIQKRTVQRRWGLPKQVLSSLKAFLPGDSLRKNPLAFSKEFAEESVGKKKEEMGQMLTDFFSSKQKSTMQNYVERKYLNVHLEKEPKLVGQSWGKADGLGKEPKREEISPVLAPSTSNVPHKQWTSARGMSRSSLGALPKILASQQNAYMQEVDIPYLQSGQRESLEFHIKKKRLQHEWGLPGTVQRSIQAFAPSLLVPTCPQGRGQEVRICTKEPSFLPDPSQKALEHNLKCMIIHRQWSLAKKTWDSLRAFSPTIGKALKVPKEGHENHLEEEIYFSGKSQQATEKVRASSSQSSQTRGSGSIIHEKPQPGRRVSLSTGSSQMEGQAIAGKTPPAIAATAIESEEEEVGLQASENIAYVTPQATEEKAFAAGSPENAAYETMALGSSVASLGVETTSETLPFTDDAGSVTQTTLGAAATGAAIGPTSKVSHDSKGPLSVQDASLQSESPQAAEESSLLNENGEKEEQTVWETIDEGSVVDSLETIEEESTSRPQTSQATEEDEESSQPSEEEDARILQNLQTTGEETSLESQSPQSAEETNSAKSQNDAEATEEDNVSGSLQETEGTSMVTTEIPCTAEQGSISDLSLLQKLQHPGAGHVRSKALTCSKGSPPKCTPNPPWSQLPPSQFRGHSGCKVVQTMEFQGPTKVKLDPHSGLQKKQAACRTELKLWVGCGGRTSSLVSSEKQTFSASPEPPPSTEIPEGEGRWQIKPKRNISGTLPPQGRAPLGKIGLRSAVHIGLRKMMLTEGSEPLPEPLEEKSRQQPPLLLPRENSSRRWKPITETMECHSAERGLCPMVSSHVETLLWDKVKVFQQLECSMTPMVPRYPQRPYSPHPVVLREPFSAAHSHMISPPCLCHAAGYQRGLVFQPGREVDERWLWQEEACTMGKDAGTSSSISPDDDENHEDSHLSSTENATDTILPRSEMTRETFPRLPKGAVLGSSMLPPCVIYSHSDYEETVPRPTKHCRRCWEEQSRLFHHRKAQLQKKAEGIPLQTQEHRNHLDDGRWQRSVARHAREPMDWVGASLSEASLIWECLSTNISMNRASLEKHDHETIDIAPESSSGSSEASQKSSQQLKPVATSLDDLPAPPSDWFESEIESETAKNDLDDRNGIHVLDPMYASQPKLANLHKECCLSVEEQSQFTTECEWERIGDWDSDHMPPHIIVSSAKEDEGADQNMRGRPTTGHCPMTGGGSESQGNPVSFETEQDPNNMVVLIGSILERKLSMDHGYHLWLQSQGKGRVARWEKSQEGAPTLEENEVGQEVKPFRMVFLGAEQPVMEGDVPERQGTDRKGHQTTGAPFQNIQSPTVRHSIPTSPASSQKTSKGKNRENHEVARPDHKCLSGRIGSKVLGMEARVEGLRRQEAHCPDKPVERTAGIHRGMSINEQGSPAGSPKTPSIRVQSSQKREKESMHRVRFTSQCSTVMASNVVQDDVNGLPSEQASTTSRSSQCSGGFFKSHFSKLLCSQEQQTKVKQENGRQTVHSTANSQRLSTGHHHVPAPSTQLGGSVPSKDKFRSLKDRILLRRRVLWTSSDSEEKPPV